MSLKTEKTVTDAEEKLYVERGENVLKIGAGWIRLLSKLFSRVHHFFVTSYI